jgi:REP element-mobilizing transposase RayT
MPDHAHMILRPPTRHPGLWWDLAQIMKRIKGTSARIINASLGTTGQVWQKESFDRIIRDESEFWKHWRYMYLNPLKAGLVDNPEEYEFFVRP